jgi:predicted amidohydrolase YtcJ
MRTQHVVSMALLTGAIVVPGLIDAHAHLMGLGHALMRVDLVGTRSNALVRPCGVQLI